VQQMEQFFFGEGAALPPNTGARVNLSAARQMIRAKVPRSSGSMQS
jgi:hypothetical protein